MALGNYKPRNGGGKEGRSVAAQLARHFKLMNDFIAQGMDRDAASKKALRIVTGKESE